MQRSISRAERTWWEALALRFSIRHESDDIPHSHLTLSMLSSVTGLLGSKCLLVCLTSLKRWLHHRLKRQSPISTREQTTPFGFCFFWLNHVNSITSRNRAGMRTFAPMVNHSNQQARCKKKWQSKQYQSKMPTKARSTRKMTPYLAPFQKLSQRQMTDLSKSIPRIT